ncbi:MAG: type II toxin-antitoxin system RelE/ParE family toxin [Oscillospiraceae bacterium]|nr:type II toxin-antitoxin system RelE/ParE family toxin [Oscillospiraceae bacterium]
MYKLEIMKAAQYDYKDILEYLSQFYESTPKKFTEELNKFYDILEESPYAFMVYEPNTQYRRMVVADYLVFYKVFEETKRVEIHRILHGARNIVI